MYITCRFIAVSIHKTKKNVFRTGLNFTLSLINYNFLMEKKRTEDLMEMLRLKEAVVQMAKANGVRWYGHVLRRDDGYVLRKALEFEVKGKRKRERPKKTWKT